MVSPLTDEDLEKQKQTILDRKTEQASKRRKRELRKRKLSDEEAGKK
jgi:hypothetical protein